MADLEKATAELDKTLRAEEGERLRPYLCDAKVPTIGVGATTYLDGRKVSLADPPITREQMDRMLSIEIDRYCASVLEMVDGECTTGQLVGLVLCGYNVGLPPLQGSSMIRLHRQGQYAAAARAFSLWNKYRPDKGEPLREHPSLTARRLREAAIYSAPDEDAPHRPAPQAVAPESSLRASPIARGGAITGATAAATGASALSDQLGTAGSTIGAVKAFAGQVVDFIGLPPKVLLCCVLGLAAWYIIKWRKKQRDGGYA